MLNGVEKGTMYSHNTIFHLIESISSVAGVPFENESYSIF